MPNSPAKTNNKQGGRFQPGQSGNPNGRPHEAKIRLPVIPPFSEGRINRIV